MVYMYDVTATIGIELEDLWIDLITTFRRDGKLEWWLGLEFLKSQNGFKFQVRE